MADQWLCLCPLFPQISLCCFFSLLSISRLSSFLPWTFEPPPRLARFSTTTLGGPGLSHLGFRGSLASLRTDQRLTGLPRPWFKLNPSNTRRLDVLHTDDIGIGGYLSPSGVDTGILYVPSVVLTLITNTRTPMPRLMRVMKIASSPVPYACDAIRTSRPSSHKFRASLFPVYPSR